MTDQSSAKLLKRKRTFSASDACHDDVDEDSGNNEDYGLESDRRLRQRLVELSVAKVRTAAPLTPSLRRRELPLLRSVLILNTLRAADAASAWCRADPTLCSAVVAPSTPFRSPLSPADLAAERPDRLDGSATKDQAPDSSFVLDDLFGSERTSPALTFSSPFDLDATTLWPSEGPPTAVSSSSSPSSSSSSQMDVDFDLDVELFDFDLVQPLTPAPAVDAAAWLRPSSAAAVGPASTAGLSGHGLPTPSCTGQRSQLVVDELERIVQILVGS